MNEQLSCQWDAEDMVYAQFIMVTAQLIKR